jgi:hypothetical protein
MPQYIIRCPACLLPISVDSAMIGSRGRCSDCHAQFVLNAAADGSPTPKQLSTYPKMLIIPTVGLLLLGISGLVVNGYLALLFWLKPGEDLAYSRAQLVQLRTMRALSHGSKPDPDWEHSARAAMSGVAAAAYTARIAEDIADEPVAQIWAPNMLRIQTVFVFVSLFVLLGGILVLRGKLYYLTFVCCLAAMLNFNHLCCIPGAIVGIWGIVMLARDDIRSHFGR